MTAHATPEEFRLLEKRMGGGSRQEVDDITVNFNLKGEFMKLSEEDRVKYTKEKKMKILQYWELKRFSHPELYKLSQVVLSIPSTQVSVERSFSAMALIVSHLRTRLSSETINELMIVKQNIDPLSKVNFV